ncbi:hypothetical protein GOP47_0009912 [Adiantum capillus-veneris]|uniref:U-box domain-containing protein n=1 Tax=Adiantum capillus-veneris TaxID=13818 RepID=A0A9D4ZJX9_ADICA|nr:hypothetical protein GOP47_0009912 [Adiantum capillus-veneris]
MDIKLKTSQMLLLKLASGCGDAKLDAVAEIRLFSKWDDANRTSLAKAGAVPSLFKVLDDSRIDARLQENVMAALLNMSINADVKKHMVREPGGLDAVLRITNNGANTEVKANAAALLYSLLADDGARKIVCSNEMLGETLVALLKDGSARCKAEALKSMFVLAKDKVLREILLQEKYELLGLLVSLVTVGKVKLTEDCLAVLALLASCDTGAKALMQVSSVVPILTYLVNSGSPRGQENATAVLLSVCRHDEGARQAMPVQTLVPALNSLRMGDSERGKDKADALLGLLGFDQYSSVAGGPNLGVSMGDSDLSVGSYYGRPGANTMPFIPTHPAHINYSPPHQAKRHSHVVTTASPSPTVSDSFSNASWPKPTLKNKYMTLARSLFTPKARNKSHSSIN